MNAIIIEDEKLVARELVESITEIIERMFGIFVAYIFYIKEGIV